MKFQTDTAAGVNVISRHEPQRVWVGGSAHAHSLLVPWVGQVQAWPVAKLADLTEAHFLQVLGLQPELVIVGSGTRQRFLAADLLRPLLERRIGVETMDTPAACRTYNVLAGEHRRVLAALLLAPPP